MTIKTWLELATQDAERRALTGMRPLLEALARASATLRMADWNDDASGQHESQHDSRHDAARRTDAR